MDSGVILRHTRLVKREGLIVHCQIGERIGRGEIAPLPEFSQETWSQAKEQAQQVLTDWLADVAIDWDSLYPSVAFGLSMAFAELEYKLPLQGNYSLAPLCSGDPDELLQMFEDNPWQNVAKMKVGMYEAIRDGMVVNMFFEALPHLRLRLDANRQWTLEKAQKFADYIHPDFKARIDFIEEPCTSVEQSLIFAKTTQIAIAWDESSREGGFKLEKQQGVNAIVLKPTLIGSIEKVACLVKHAHQLGMTAVISSSLESSFGLNQLARLAYWLTPNTPPGLDTNNLFQMQLETPWPKSTLALQPLNDCDLCWQQSSLTIF